MKFGMEKTVGWICILVILIGVAMASAQTGEFKGKLPVITTSAGQSADVNTLNVIMEQAEIGYDYCDVPTVEMFKDGVTLGGRESGDGFHVETTTDTETYKAGTPYKSIIFAIGASLKGMGASGLTIDDELKRLVSLIKYCKDNKIQIIAVHAGGESKRGASGSDNEKMIDAIAPHADLLIVVDDSNKDGRFTTICEEKKIPLKQVKYALGIVNLMQEVYE